MALPLVAAVIYFHVHWDQKSDKEFRKQKLTDDALGQPLCGSVSKQFNVNYLFLYAFQSVFPSMFD